MLSQMSDTKTKSSEKTAPAATISAKKEGTKKSKPRNYDLGNGLYRFSRSRMYHKKAIYKFVDKKTPKVVSNIIRFIYKTFDRIYEYIFLQVKLKKPLTREKEIGGDKNGEKRVVLLKKRRANYPTADPITKKHTKKCFHEHHRYLRPTLVPGTICILLAGSHKGKRVVFLKQLKTGLLLVTGWF